MKKPPDYDEKLRRGKSQVVDLRGVAARDRQRGLQLMQEIDKLSNMASTNAVSRKLEKSNRRSNGR